MDLSLQSLDENLALSELYLIHGDEDLLRIEALDALRRAAKKQSYLEREVFSVDAHFNWSEIDMALDSPSLFSDLKLVEIHVPSGKPGKNGGDALFRLSQKKISNTVLVLVFPKLEKAQLSSKWFVALTKQATVLEAKSIQSNRLPEWIRRRLALSDLKIEPDALTLFADRVEGNLLAAKQEIDKLALLYPSGSVVSMEDAQNAIANVARFDVFQLATAWMSGDKQRLQRMSETLQASGDDPVIVLWAISEDIRTLLRLEGALKQGQSVGQVRNSLRLWGDKQQLAPRALQRIGAKKLMNALQECALIDRQIKGAQSGDAWDSTINLLMNLAS